MTGVVICEMSSMYHLPISGVDAATTGDTPIAIPFSNYLVRRITITGATANLAATTATASLRTAAADAGTAIVSLQALTALVAAATILDATLAVTAVAQTASTLYFRIVQGVSPVAGAINVVLEVQPLP